MKQESEYEMYKRQKEEILKKQENDLWESLLYWQQRCEAAEKCLTDAFDNYPANRIEWLELVNQDKTKQ